MAKTKLNGASRQTPSASAKSINHNGHGAYRASGGCTGACAATYAGEALSALCEPSYVEMMQEAATESGYPMPPAEHCGYTLIDGHLVPEIFIQCVQEELSEHHFEYGQVLCEDCMFESDFLDSLDHHERAVLMPVVLILVARGDLGLNLWTEPRARVGGAQ